MNRIRARSWTTNKMQRYSFIEYVRWQQTYTIQYFFFWYSAVRSRSMTPITWKAAVDDEEQRPLLQDILEAAVDDRRQAAVDVEEQRPQLQDIFEAAIDGNHV